MLPISLDSTTMPTARLAAHILKDIVLGISEQDTPVPHSDIKIFRESLGTLSSSTAGAGTGAPGGSLAEASGSYKARRSSSEH